MSSVLNRAIESAHPVTRMAVIWNIKGSMAAYMEALLCRIGGRGRRGGGWRSRGGLRGGGLLLHPAHRDDRTFIQRQQRYRDRCLANADGSSPGSRHVE